MDCWFVGYEEKGRMIDDRRSPGSCSDLDMEMRRNRKLPPNDWKASSTLFPVAEVLPCRLQIPSKQCSSQIWD